jgi:predicted phosphodiesterase
MRIAVISDIHGNIEALREVLADIEQAGADSVVCLGDLIGYGPDPEEVVRLVRSRAIPSVLGNHELGIVQPEFLAWFNASARQSLEMTAGFISGASTAFLHTLPRMLVSHGGLFVHGCPPDSPMDYIFEMSARELYNAFNRTDQPVSFVGHTHLLGLVSLEDDKVKHTSLGEGIARLKEGVRYIVNVGAVGQPRDGNNNAKYVIWNTSEKIVEVRFVPYDIAATAEKILQLGLPRINASRLW